MKNLSRRMDELPHEVVEGDHRIMTVEEIKIFLTAIARGQIDDSYINKRGEEMCTPAGLNTRIRAAEAMAKMLGAYDVPSEVPALPAPRVAWTPGRRIEVARQALQAKNRSEDDDGSE